MHSQPGRPSPGSSSGTSLIPKQRCACAQPSTWPDFLAFTKLSQCRHVCIAGLSEPITITGHVLLFLLGMGAQHPTSATLPGWLDCHPHLCAPDSAIPSLSLQSDFGHCLLERLVSLSVSEGFNTCTLDSRLELFASFPARTGISYQL